MSKYPPLVIIGYSLGPVFIIVSHLGCLLPLAIGISPQALLWGFALYWIRMLGITAIYHRLIIHKSYQAPAIVKWVGCFIASSAGQMGPNWWKAHHQAHHQASDLPNDTHSPNAPSQGLKGFIWSQWGWLLAKTFFPSSLPPDVEADPILKLIDRLHFIPLISLGILSYALGGLDFLGAFFLSTTILFHGVATVNSLAHLYGKQPFVSQDKSRNNWFVAFLTLGEGWHNLHHACQWSARHGFTVKDGKVVSLLDPTYSFIRLLERLGLASNIRLPSEAELLQKTQKAAQPACTERSRSVLQRL